MRYSADSAVRSGALSNVYLSLSGLWTYTTSWDTTDTGETIQKISDTTSISSDGTTYTKMGSTTVGSDGSMFTQMGSFSTDGSTRMGSTATGLGAVFNDRKQDRFGFDADDDEQW